MAGRIGDLYERDFLEWSTRNAELLRSGRVEEADLEHIAEEIEDLGISERRALESRLIVLLSHLLKWQFQAPGTRSWKTTIGTQRIQIARLLRKIPSLRSGLAEVFSDVYPDARLIAATEADLPAEQFPAACPYSVEETLDPAFLPSPTPRSGS
jgi:Domain of unknown function DUF29